MGADLGFCDAIEAFFRRGDTDGTGGLDITDPIFLLAFLFRDSTEPPCRKAADVDDSGSLDITDAVHLLNFLFLSGPPPHVPFPDCGVDPTPDALGCRTGRICR
ncbi:MAG: hypothetical protein JXP34_06760 [Planctomycetes bacterium]|nr:hypothetical protein [Planctomycetota bacterium]